MIIGIDGSRAFLRQRTGIEEYSYQVIKNLRNGLAGHEVFLYIRRNQEIDFEIPDNWQVKKIGWMRFWTQIGLSLEVLLHPTDVLFVPAHTVPWIHPRKTVVTMHGLEYEMMPKAYSMWERLYMRVSIRNSCRWASEIISVSENTKKDLMHLYQVPEENIQVVQEGYEKELQILDAESRKFEDHKPYLLFIGRLEERKNILGIIEAFEILKEKYVLPHKLLLAGKGGYGYEKIGSRISNSKFQIDIVELGFVMDGEKFSLIAGADVFLFPTFYEGFGIPVLEAQSVGVPVVTSNVSSLPEVTGDSALLVDPEKPEEIAESTYSLVSDKALRDDIIEKGYENVKRFSWEKCAQEIAGILTK
jgi:glycosyltransferase involved in cell wall biosynthesis